jgi:hypothetical protein
MPNPIPQRFAHPWTLGGRRRRLYAVSLLGERAGELAAMLGMFSILCSGGWVSLLLPVGVIATVYGRRRRAASWDGLTIPRSRITNPLAVSRINAAAYFVQPTVTALAVLSWTTSPGDGYLVALLSAAWFCGAAQLWVRHRQAGGLDVSITAQANLAAAVVTASLALTSGGLTFASLAGTLLVYLGLIAITYLVVFITRRQFLRTNN